MIKKRSLRRHHAERLKEKRSSFYNSVHKDDPKRLGQLVHTATVCSCIMCGNPRTHFGNKTIQEQKSELFGMEE
jgi:hypothetical protein